MQSLMETHAGHSQCLINVLCERLTIAIKVAMRDTVGDFRLEITPEIRRRDHMYSIQKTAEWKYRYKIRSGIEATNSELKRSHGIGKLRVRRAAKVCFAVACKVIACNIKRWAKAHSAQEGPLQGFISSIFDRLKIFQSDFFRISIFQRTIFALGL
jgi:hypothetical protein